MTTGNWLPTGKIKEAAEGKILSIESGHTGWLVFNNPERRNAMSRAMWDAVPELIANLEANSDIKALVLMGAGEKAFISGADISEFKEQRERPEAEDQYRAATEAAWGAIEASRLPTVAMIRGACMGGGLATALSCDIRIASEDATFAIPAAKLGIGYPFAGIQKLVALLGPAQAKAMMFTAEAYSAGTAHTMGLINEVTCAVKLEQRVRELTDAIARNAPLTIQAAKLSIDQAVMDAGSRDMDRVQQAIDRAMNSDDVKEGHQAFLEKRAPDFKGR